MKPSALLNPRQWSPLKKSKSKGRATPPPAAPLTPPATANPFPVNTAPVVQPVLPTLAVPIPVVPTSVEPTPFNPIPTGPTPTDPKSDDFHSDASTPPPISEAVAMFNAEYGQEAPAPVLSQQAAGLAAPVVQAQSPSGSLLGDVEIFSAGSSLQEYQKDDLIAQLTNERDMACFQRDRFDKRQRDTFARMLRIITRGNQLLAEAATKAEQKAAEVAQKEKAETERTTKIIVALQDKIIVMTQERLQERMQDQVTIMGLERRLSLFETGTQ